MKLKICFDIIVTLKNIAVNDNIVDIAQSISNKAF